MFWIYQKLSIRRKFIMFGSSQLPKVTVNVNVNVNINVKANVNINVNANVNINVNATLLCTSSNSFAMKTAGGSILSPERVLTPTHLERRSRPFGDVPERRCHVVIVHVLIGEVPEPLGLERKETRHRGATFSAHYFVFYLSSFTTILYLVPYFLPPIGYQILHNIIDSMD